MPVSLIVFDDAVVAGLCQNKNHPRSNKDNANAYIGCTLVGGAVVGPVFMTRHRSSRAHFGRRRCYVAQSHHLVTIMGKLSDAVNALLLLLFLSDPERVHRDVFLKWIGQRKKIRINNWDSIT
mmetsp:Transcript_50393/g.57053  ORF Transcript_50393/g.57053 Transcript_50393/m.57053 type:complete len:123 (-) Transcript_50393:31-399(-)